MVRGVGGAPLCTAERQTRPRVFHAAAGGSAACLSGLWRSCIIDVYQAEFQKQPSPSTCAA